MKKNKEKKGPFLVRFATLDDVPELKEMPGENEVRTNFLHEAVMSPRQGIIILEGPQKTEAYIKIRLTDIGVKIDDFKFSEDKEKNNLLISTVESIPKKEPIYLYIDPKSKHRAFLEDLGYEKYLETDEGKIKMIKKWGKIEEDNEIENEYHRRVQETEERYEVLQPRSVYGGEMLDRNISLLEKKIKEMRRARKKKGAEKEETECDVCGRKFGSERGMKIHRTKKHGKES